MFRGDRLLKLIEDLRISQGELARRVGISTTAIWKLTKEPAQGSKHLHKIAKALGTSPEYLMGETDDPSPGTVSADRQLPVRHTEPEANPDLVEIDHVDIGFGMGGSFIEGHVEVEKRSFSRAWLRGITDTPPHLLAWAKGQGDSMEPTIRDGEGLLLDRSFTQPGPDDKIWAFTIGDFGMIKRLRVLSNGTIEIHSDNDRVPIATAVDSELFVIGRVIAVLRRV